MLGKCPAVGIAGLSSFSSAEIGTFQRSPKDVIVSLIFLMSVSITYVNQSEHLKESESI